MNNYFNKTAIFEGTSKRTHLFQEMLDISKKGNDKILFSFKGFQMLHVCMHLIKNAKMIIIIMIWTNAGKRNIVLHTSEISTQQVTHSKLLLKAFVFQTATQ